MERNVIRSAGALALCLAASAASAHSGSHFAIASTEAAGLLQGFLHPFTGVDHLLALLTVGVWSAWSGHRSWVVPLAFVNCMLLGALMGMSGLAPSGLEPLLAGSLVVLGVLLAVRQAVATSGAGLMLAGFGLLHGVAHGLEFGPQATLDLPLGMLASSLVLMAAGVLAGGALRQANRVWQRLGGGSVALLGGVLLAQMV